MERFLNALLTGSIPGSLKSRMSRIEKGTYPTDLEIRDGYPSEEKLEEIRMVSFKDARRWLHDEFPRLWGELSYGNVTVNDNAETVVGDPAREIYVATGGWSGCEDVIYAVLDHVTMANYCRVRRSGGGYTFIVPHE